MNAATQVRALAGAETKLLLRNKTLVVSAAVVPLAVGIYMLVQGMRDDDPRWGSLFGLCTVLVLMMAVYAALATSLTARRQDLFLKRLRSGEISDAAILAGIVVPTAVLGAAQLVVLAVFAVIAGAGAPEQPHLVVAAIVLGALMAGAAAAATSGITPSAERAQITTLPLYFAALAGAIVISVQAPADVNPLLLAIPGAAPAQLARIGWEPRGAGAAEILAALAFLVAWVVLFADLAKRYFRWDRR